MASEKIQDLMDEAVRDATEDTVADKLEQHGEAFIDFWGDIQANILNSMNARSAGPDGIVENIQDDVGDDGGCTHVSLDMTAFCAAVDWSERWIQGVLAFHLSLWIFFIVTRKNFGAQVGLFVVVLVGTRSSEYINTVLGNRWHTFSRQNYFDDRGVFMGVMWAAPLLILGFTMLVSLLCQAASLMVAVKTQEFKRAMAKKNGSKSKPKAKSAKDKEPSKQE